MLTDRSTGFSVGNNGSRHTESVNVAIKQDVYALCWRGCRILEEDRGMDPILKRTQRKREGERNAFKATVTFKMLMIYKKTHRDTCLLLEGQTLDREALLL